MILVAPTAFKETFSAAAVADAIAEGIDLARYGEARFQLLSDGGTGLIDAMGSTPWGAQFTAPVTGPLGEPVRARFLVGTFDKGSALAESADACGIHLVPESQRDVLRATTYGVGELIREAATFAAHVIVGVGGTATIDCGLGMAQALGWRLLNERGQPVKRGGHAVLKLAYIERTGTVLPRITALTDVRNPLYGPNGAAHVFGAQKGGTSRVIEELDDGLERVAEIIRRDVGVDVAKTEGAGAGGGLAAGLQAFAGATLVSGSEWVLEQTGFDQLLDDADLVITGEGRYDAQSTMGKITGAVIARAGARNVPVLLVTGSVSGALPPHVHAVTGAARLGLDDISRLVRDALPRLLTP